MKNLADSGESGMEPLLDFRDWLRKIRNDETKRQTYRRNLQDGLGPFTKETRAEILRRLLEIQRETGQNLISREELSGIQYVWYHDFHEPPNVEQIYAEIYEEETPAMREEIAKRQEEEHKLLEELCAKEGIDPSLVEQLLQIEKDKSGLMRRHNLFQEIDMALKRYLKYEDEKLKLSAQIS